MMSAEIERNMEILEEGLWRTSMKPLYMEIMYDTIIILCIEEVGKKLVSLELAKRGSMGYTIGYSTGAWVEWQLIANSKTALDICREYDIDKAKTIVARAVGYTDKLEKLEKYRKDIGVLCKDLRGVHSIRKYLVESVKFIESKSKAYLSCYTNTVMFISSTECKYLDIIYNTSALAMAILGTKPNGDMQYVYGCNKLGCSSDVYTPAGMCVDIGTENIPEIMGINKDEATKMFSNNKQLTTLDGYKLCRNARGIESDPRNCGVVRIRRDDLKNFKKALRMVEDKLV